MRYRLKSDHSHKVQVYFFEGFVSSKLLKFLEECPFFETINLNCKTQKFFIKTNNSISYLQDDSVIIVTDERINSRSPKYFEDVFEEDKPTGLDEFMDEFIKEYGISKASNTPSGMSILPMFKLYTEHLLRYLDKGGEA